MKPGSLIMQRVQAVFGLERIVDMTIARKVPQIAYGTTVGIRFMNNIVGKLIRVRTVCLN